MWIKYINDIYKLGGIKMKKLILIFSFITLITIIVGCTGNEKENDFKSYSNLELNIEDYIPSGLIKDDNLDQLRSNGPFSLRTLLSSNLTKTYSKDTITGKYSKSYYDLMNGAIELKKHFVNLMNAYNDVLGNITEESIGEVIDVTDNLKVKVTEKENGHHVSIAHLGNNFRSEMSLKFTKVNNDIVFESQYKLTNEKTGNVTATWLLNFDDNKIIAAVDIVNVVTYAVEYNKGNNDVKTMKAYVNFLDIAKVSIVGTGDEISTLTYNVETIGFTVDGTEAYKEGSQIYIKNEGKIAFIPFKDYAWTLYGLDGWTTVQTPNQTISKTNHNFNDFLITFDDGSIISKEFSLSPRIDVSLGESYNENLPGNEEDKKLYDILRISHNDHNTMYDLPLVLKEKFILPINPEDLELKVQNSEELHKTSELSNIPLKEIEKIDVLSLLKIIEFENLFE